MGNSDLLSSCNSLVSWLRILYKDWEGVKQLENTPGRLEKMYRGFCWSLDEIKVELDRQFRVFENGFNEMLVTGPITVWVLCPHHLLPVELKVSIGYVPSGKVLGLSKFARIAEVIGRRPIMQEQYSKDLANELYSRLQPKGVAVYVVGHHDCMRARGVRQDAPVVTSIIIGVFEEHPTREEFFAIARGNR